MSFYFVSAQTNQPVEYIAQVEEVLSDGTFYVSYLKQYNNRQHEFVFPQAVQEETVQNEDMISVLPAPLIKRGHYIFPYDVL